MRDVLGPDQADALQHAADDEDPAEQKDQGHGSDVGPDQRHHAGNHQQHAFEQIPGRITLDRLAHGLAHGGRRLCHCHRHLSFLQSCSNQSPYTAKILQCGSGGVPPDSAIAGLDPAIHSTGLSMRCGVTAWMPGDLGESGMSQDEARRSAIAKAGRRLLPFLCLCYAVNFLDRVNVGFAALAMNDDLGFSPSVFGVGAGIFFAGYILFEVPSNLAMQKFGARIWIARIMISWGLVAIAMAFVSGERSFYAHALSVGRRRSRASSPASSSISLIGFRRGNARASSRCSWRRCRLPPWSEARSRARCSRCTGCSA